jgi:hypothetical protein
MPLSADLEIKVTETAQLEWNSTVKATFVRDGDGVDDSDIFATDGLTRQASERPMGNFLFYLPSLSPTLATWFRCSFLLYQYTL